MQSMPVTLPVTFFSFIFFEIKPFRPILKLDFRKGAVYIWLTIPAASGPKRCHFN